MPNAIDKLTTTTGPLSRPVKVAYVIQALPDAIVPMESKTQHVVTMTIKAEFYADAKDPREVAYQEEVTKRMVAELLYRDVIQTLLHIEQVARGGDWRQAGELAHDLRKELEGT